MSNNELLELQANLKLHLLPEEQINIKVCKCPRCNSIDIIGHGKYKGNNRYLCKDCKKTFTTYHGTGAHRLKKKELFSKFVDYVFEYPKSTLEHLCKVFKISTQTAHDWRHKMAKSWKKNDFPYLGETQIDDVNVAHNRKGRKGVIHPKKKGFRSKAGDSKYLAKLLFTHDRNNGLDVNLMTMGRITKEELGVAIKDRLTNTSVMISDRHSSFRGFFHDLNIEHKTFKSKEYKKGDWHVNNINAHANNFKAMINTDFRGVATKYLQNYANFYMLLAVKKIYGMAKVKEIIFSNRDTWANHAKREVDYKEFMEKTDIGYATSVKIRTRLTT